MGANSEVPAVVEFVSRPNKRCLKGLHIEYEVAVEIDVEEFFLAIDPDHSLFRSEENWGDRRICKGIRKFRFEVRTGTADRIVDFLHRVTASTQERKKDRDDFEAVLSRL